MSRAYTNLLFHIVFATNNRGKNLTGSIQDDFYPFSVSQSRRQKVLAYICGQEKRHRRHTFEDEYVGLLKKNEIEFKEVLWG